MIKRIGFTAIAAIALSVAAQAADMHMHIGTWVMNVAKSTFSNGYFPRSMTQVISMDGGWMIFKNNGVDKDGKATRVNLMGKDDGVARPSMLNGPTAVGGLSTGTRSDDFHRKTVWIAITGKARTTQVVVISPDGKVKTRTTTGVDKDGKSFNNMQVFDKQ